MAAKTPEWTDEDLERFAGVLGRSADRVRRQRLDEASREATRRFLAPVLHDVMQRSDADLPTGARALVVGAALSTIAGDANGC